MTTFFALVGVVLLAYRVFVKGESTIVKNPNWKMHGLAIFAMGLVVIATMAYQLVLFHLHNVPIISITWVMLAAGIVFSVIGARFMVRVSRV